MKKSYTLFSVLAISSPVLADMDNARFEQQGFGGEISLMTGYFSTKSNLSTETKTKTGSLNSAAKSDSSFMFAPAGQVHYTFGQQQLFLDASLEMGYALALNDSVITLSYIPSSMMADEVWKDPYLVNIARETTDVSGNTYRIQWENLADMGIDAELAYYDQKIDKEFSGSAYSTATQQLLKRGGDGYLLGLSTGVPLSETLFVMPSMRYYTFNADGKAMAFDQYGVGLGIMHELDDGQMISLNTELSKADYDASNPIFNKSREDLAYVVNLSYEYDELLGYEDLGFMANAGYENKDSNINFYDQTNYMLGVGVSYSF